MYFFSVRGFLSRKLKIRRTAVKSILFFFLLPLPPSLENSDIYLQLCMQDEYHVFLMATLVTSRLLLDEIYHLIQLPFDWLIVSFVCLLNDLILQSEIKQLRKTLVFILIRVIREKFILYYPGCCCFFFASIDKTFIFGVQMGTGFNYII